jgi:fructokinase
MVTKSESGLHEMTSNTDRGKGRCFGAIEAGGTKFVCGVGTCPSDIRINEQPTENRKEFKTEDGPEIVLTNVVKWFREMEKKLGCKISAIGIASFGPVDLNENNKASYGCITSTPKLSWRGANLLEPLRTEFGHTLPIGLDTDVNGAALGEFTWGAAKNIEDFVYVSIGTGLGAGAMSRGRLLHGLVHPEMGHMLLPRIPGDTFPGICTKHGSCWEGLCSGKAIQSRTGRLAENLEREDSAWIFTTRYIGYALANLIFVLSPRRIIIGGSVRKAGKLGQDQFFERIRDEVQSALAGYVVSDSLDRDIKEYIVPPALGDDAGVCGAFELARKKLSGDTV